MLEIRDSNSAPSEGLSRRRLLMLAGPAALGIAWPAAARVQAPSGKIPFALIIDDGSPVDPLFYEIPGYETPLLIPHEFIRRVGDAFDRFDMRGKFTVIPMPSCMGRIDQTVKKVPPAHLAGFLDLMRKRIAPRFDITPEFLTHMRAYDLAKGGYKHIYEDVWISGAPPAEIVDYFVLAFRILNNVGLPATGITSPWVAGIDVEKKYAEALADAQWKVYQRKLTWYFLHGTSWGPPRRCSVEYESAARGQAVVSVPANFADIFWTMEIPTRAARIAAINGAIDKLISPDGRSGRIRQLIETGYPVVLISHWQSLFTQGTGLGLEGLTWLGERIRKVFGSRMEWVTCSELARRFVQPAKQAA